MPQGQITEHFSWAELGCRCGECSGWGDDHIRDEIQETARWLEKVRAVLGNLPLRISSGYRCKSHNAAVGGAPNSQHLLGRAVDFGVKALSPATVQKVLKAHWGEGALIRGLGTYRGWTHIDRRDGPPATWRG